jgi:2-phosphoglycerate kinase
LGQLFINRKLYRKSTGFGGKVERWEGEKVIQLMQYIHVIVELISTITWMISRDYWLSLTMERLNESPVVALLGPRQVGKTTLAMQVAESRSSVYLD